MGGWAEGSSVPELPRAPEPHKTLGVWGGSPQSPMQGPAWGERPGLFSLGVGRAGAQAGARFSICLLRSSTAGLPRCHVPSGHRLWGWETGPSWDSVCQLGKGGAPPQNQIPTPMFAGRKQNQGALRLSDHQSRFAEKSFPLNQ